jgi:hypothetical protein
MQVEQALAAYFKKQADLLCRKAKDSEKLQFRRLPDGMCVF